MRSLYGHRALILLVLFVSVVGGCAHIPVQQSPAAVAVPEAAPTPAPAPQARPDGLYAARQHYRQSRPKSADEGSDPAHAVEYAFEYALEYGFNCALEDTLQSPVSELRQDPFKCGLKANLEDALEWGLRYMLEDLPQDLPESTLNAARDRALAKARETTITAALDPLLSDLAADDAAKTSLRETLTQAISEVLDEAFAKALDTALRGAPKEEVPEGMFGWPVDYPDMYITSAFGFRGRTSGGRGGMHTGVDIIVPMGTPVMAAAPGTVAFAGPSGSGYGNMIKLDHGNGFETWYAHLSAYNVHSGDHVAAGSRIGAAGQTGRATTSHLHYEVHKDGSAVDPEPYLP